MDTKHGRRAQSVQSQVEIDKIVGSNLRRLRIERGLTQAALSDKLGISLLKVQCYEAGTNTLSASGLVAVTAIMGCRLIELFRGDLAADA